MKFAHFKVKLHELIGKLPFGGFLIQLILSVCHPIQYIAICKDYVDTRRRFKFIRRYSFGNDPNKTALILSFSDWIYQLKVESMLALGLMQQGWRVKVLNFKRNFRGRLYFRAMGINDFISWEDTDLTKLEKSRCEEEKDKFLSKPFTFRDVKGWIYDGAKIGPQIISSVSRSEMRGAPDMEDPAIRKQIVEWLPKTLENVRRAQKIIKTLSPQMVFVNEANYAFNGPLVDCAIHSGINTIQFVQPFQDNGLVFKRLNAKTRRHNPNSVSPETLYAVKDLPWRQGEDDLVIKELRDRYSGKWFLQSRNQPGVKRKTKEDIVKQLGLDPAKKIAVMFSHVLWDANLFYGDDLFEDYGDWFVQTVKYACQNPNVNWIIKMHPANLWKRAREKVTSEYSEIQLIKHEIGELPSHVKLLYPNTDISTLSLFEIADYCVTVRGTPGMEAPCFGVLVFTAGTGRYSGLGFTNDSNTKEEYMDKMLHIHNSPKMTKEQIILAKKHAYMIFRKRVWTMKSFKSAFNYKKKGVHPLDHNLHLIAKTFDELEKNGDLKKWALFAQDTAKIDYLDEDGIEEWRGV